MIKSYFQAFAYDRDHSYLRQTRRRRSRSFVQGFIKLQYLQISAAEAAMSITDISGAGRTTTAASTSAFLHQIGTAPGRGGAGMSFDFGNTTVGDTQWSSSANNGIVVGTGTTAVSPTDYQLATQVLDGITSGTLEHFPCAVTNLTTSATQGSFDMERLFRNSSGGSITINEVGLYLGTATHGSSTAWHICAIRDLVSPGFAVANGEYMRVIYTLTVSV